MTKMKAAICTAYGAPDVLSFSEVERPQIEGDEFLVAVKYSAVSASDIAIRALEAPGDPRFPMKQLMQFGMRLFLGFQKPRNPVLGLVFSGEVVTEVSANRHFKKGDKVFGFTGASRGTYAQYKKVSAQEIMSGEVELMPEGLSFDAAAALLYGGVLAQHFMPLEALAKGKGVLVYGASGAVGTMAVQLARHHQLEVTAVCSESNFDLLRSLGASHFIDYRDQQSVSRLGTYDLVFDAVGKAKISLLKKALKNALAEGGVYRSVDDSILKMAPDNLKRLKDVFHEGGLKPVIDRVYPLSEVVAAHRYVEQGHKKGNVLLKI